jgi:hypothetical protein
MLMRVQLYTAAALITLGAATCGSARAQQLSNTGQSSNLDKETILKLLHNDPELRAAVRREIDLDDQQAKLKGGKQIGAAPASLLKAASAPSVRAQNDAAASPNAPNKLRSTTTTFLLRNSWADLGVLGACIGGGVSVDKAKGATASFTQDYVASNRIWAAQGMGAAVLSDCDLSLRPKPGGGDSGFLEKSVAIYAQVNSSYNSNAKLTSKNTDTRTAGLAGEIAYLHAGDYEVFRLTPNVVQDAIKSTSAVAVMGQYLPVWVSRPGIWHTTYTFGGNVSYQFDPTFDVQYASTTNRAKPILYSGRDQSLRVGPELTLIVTPFALGNEFWSRIGITETFHPWYEAYSSNTSYWWSNSLTYNLTSDGNFAIGISYNRGLDENSGAVTNQYVVSLNGKL